MIYTTREININGSTATIDEDIYLFKQDSNIELKFIINDTRFTFQTVESSNVVESSNASYFRVKLLNPYGKTINFPIQEVTDNYIVLLITGELIDEDTEVGDYTIQIRLYDKDKNSKLTLPAIANCIHIQQPIFNEVEENTVDTAAIDTAIVMESDEGELPVVDSTGKYIPTLWDTGDTISKAKINHIEKGILQAHTDALGAQIPHITPPDGQDTSDIINIYNELPDNGLVFFTKAYGFADAFIVGLCSVGAYTTENGNPAKTIICTSNAMSVDITSTGVILDYGISNFDLDNLMKILNNKRRTKGQVLTMTSNSEYGWADTIPHITPPKGQTTSDIINLYNMLPDNGLVYLTEGAMIQNTGIIGLCSIYSYNSDEKDLSENNVKSITCYNTGVYVDITSTGHMVDKGLTDEDLSSLMEVLRDSQRKQGQVLTLIDDDKYGWQDVIPQITPPKGQDTSDIVTVYNELPEKGLVYFTDSYNISDAYIIGLCYIDPYIDNNKPAKTIICSSTAIYANITSTGDITGTGVTNNDLDKFITDVLKNPTRQKGQVLTMLDNSNYGWTDTRPTVQKTTGVDYINLTLDPYQMIAPAKPVTSETYIHIMLPTVSPDIDTVYEIHVVFIGNSNIHYMAPDAYYPSAPPETFQDDIPYEFIFTYLSGKWLGKCIEYTIHHTNAPA